ncbi:XRE family transcriptional regulator [Novosphingobium nitrogenifigens DSM 19370]|uniref:XRE family transcriptional regulator n=1 Tax=Novosphingobium nitrogenifigens DSM 19370 TaxID=983920 RepID=F1Z9G2_9SPHN|nr:helix-turn-helix transcriptional regulator [Novosphingobium nitrogenifigens]EGD58780.1 XRE family transcriptional regulator [Novosphingobium nitrogenifigens DSM 19370]
MINRIRDIRRQKGLTLAEVAARCQPPTTAQTIGRLETGMRSLSLAWMNRIAVALEVDPQMLVKADSDQAPALIAKLGINGAEAVARPVEAIFPIVPNGDSHVVVMMVEACAGEYRTGDQIWLRQIGHDDFPRALNRDVLAPRPGGRFAFGRMIDRDGERIAILPPGIGQRQVVIDRPGWLGVAEMLVRKL